jgi:hypothetical protein
VKAQDVRVADQERLLRDVLRYGDSEERTMAIAILTGVRFTILRKTAKEV